MTGPSRSGSEALEWIAFDYAVLRVVPHVHLGAFVPVGMIVHSRTAEFLGMRVLNDPAVLAGCLPDVDASLLLRYLEAHVAVSEGVASAGPVALDSPSERFHWLTAPRSDILQTSPVHGGICRNPAAALERLFEQYVGAAVRTLR
ncbi:MAG TPA: DUF3037 domain-containing protein [Gemmatimonadales bacterium]|nr:DUF3037 domain-containing protein [Gemmatimonadales bacterium]